MSFRLFTETDSKIAKMSVTLTSPIVNQGTIRRGEEQNREEGEIGSESREKGDLPPCPPPLY